MSQKEKTELLQDDFTFDSIWTKLPQISTYQCLLIFMVTVTGGAASGLVVLWPVFAQYEPRFECVEQGTGCAFYFRSCWHF